MSGNNRYTRPALIEALLDIQVDVRPGFEWSKLAKCQQRVKGDYPVKEELRLHNTAALVGRDITTTSSSRSLGFRFFNTTKTQLFSARTDGFTFNKLGSYPGWVVFLAEARRIWAEYQRTAKPIKYKRAALRFINRFSFPTARVDLKEYFRTSPEVAPELPQDMNTFFCQINLALKEAKSNVVVTLAPTEPVVPDQVSLLFDIDVSCTEGLIGEGSLWPVFETLRLWKNKVFEASITERLREMIR